MITTWIKFFRTAISPSSASEEERPRFARMANWMKFFGLGLIVLSVGVLIWWFVEKQSYGSSPAKPVAIQDFTKQDLKGRLQEARIQGILQLDHIQSARSASGSLSALIPLTQVGWNSGDPVRVFIQTHLFLYDQKVQLTGEQFESGLSHLGLPLDSRGPILVSLIVKQPRLPTTLPVASDGAILVTYVKEAWRERDIRREVNGHLEIFKILGALGLLFTLLGYFARRSILRYVN